MASHHPLQILEKVPRKQHTVLQYTILAIEGILELGLRTTGPVSQMDIGPALRTFVKEKVKNILRKYSIVNI